MASLTEILSQQLGEDTVRQISNRLHTDQQSTQTAIGAALPMLLAGLSRQAAQPQGAEDLHGAIARDHDGSLLDNLSGFLTGSEEKINPRAAQGDAILGHIFGAKKERVESGLSQASGLDAGSAGKLLSILAPIVMGALGRQQQQSKLDAHGLAGALRQEHDEVQRGAPQQASLIGKLLDQDGDGDFDASDMLKLGAGYIGRMFKK